MSANGTDLRGFFRRIRTVSERKESTKDRFDLISSFYRERAKIFQRFEMEKEILESTKEKERGNIISKMSTLLASLAVKFEQGTLERSDFQIDCASFLDQSSPIVPMYTSSLSPKASTAEGGRKRKPRRRTTSEGSASGIDNLTDFDDFVPIDLELDFEEGEVKVKGQDGRKKTKCKSLGGTPSHKWSSPKEYESPDWQTTENEVRELMRHLMSVFEEEKKKLDKRIAFEREAARKEVEQEYREKMVSEKEYLGAVIADLVRSLEEARRENEALAMRYSEEKKLLQEFYLRRGEEERRRKALEN